MIRKLIFCIAMVLMSLGYAWADTMSTGPALVISHAGQAPRTATAYGTAQNSVTLAGTTTYTNSPMTVSVIGTQTSITSSADPVNFEVNNAISASGGTNIASVDAVGKWFTINGGTAGSSVSVTTDIYFQGHISAPSVGSTASFTNYLSYVSSTSSTTREYAIVMNGVVNPTGPASSTLAGTVDDFNRNAGTYEVNYIIRSNPFVVTVGEAFRLGLVLNATVQSAVGSDAYVSFDPGFATSILFPDTDGLFSDGFALASLNDSGGYSYAPLSSGGYSIDAIPEPATMLLVWLGLLGLVGVRGKLTTTKNPINEVML